MSKTEHPYVGIFGLHRLVLHVVNQKDRAGGKKPAVDVQAICKRIRLWAYRHERKPPAEEDVNGAVDELETGKYLKRNKSRVQLAPLGRKVLLPAVRDQRVPVKKRLSLPDALQIGQRILTQIRSKLAFRFDPRVGSENHLLHTELKTWLRCQGATADVADAAIRILILSGWVRLTSPGHLEHYLLLKAPPNRTKFKPELLLDQELRGRQLTSSDRVRLGSQAIFQLLSSMEDFRSKRFRLLPAATENYEYEIHVPSSTWPDQGAPLSDLAHFWKLLFPKSTPEKMGFSKLPCRLVDFAPKEMPEQNAGDNRNAMLKYFAVSGWPVGDFEVAVYELLAGMSARIVELVPVTDYETLPGPRAFGPVLRNWKVMPVAGASESPMTYSDDYRTVNVRGVVFTLTKNEAAVVQYLFEQWSRGIPEVSNNVLLNQAESNADDIRAAFNTSGAWGKLLGPGTRKGTSRLLNLPMLDS